MIKLLNILEEINKDRKITFLIGPPASGKSTWVSKHGKDSIVISRDNIVDELRVKHGWSYSETFKHPDFQQNVNQILKRRINSALSSDRNIVVDMTNMNRKSRANILDRVPLNYEKNAVVFNVSRGELIKRLEKRKGETGKEVPMNVVDMMIKRFEPPTKQEFDNIVEL
jgi:predicted kinase